MRSMGYAIQDGRQLAFGSIVAVVSNVLERERESPNEAFLSLLEKRELFSTIILFGWWLPVVLLHK